MFVAPPTRSASFQLPNAGKKAALAGALGLLLSISSCIESPQTGPTANERVARTYPIPDEVATAIWEIWNNCPTVGDELLNMLYNGDIYYTDVWGTYGDVAWGFFNGPILLDDSYYGGMSAEDRHTALVADLMHEAGHAIGGLTDYNYCCPHYNDYDFGCPT